MVLRPSQAGSTAGYRTLRSEIFATRFAFSCSESRTRTEVPCIWQNPGPLRCTSVHSWLAVLTLYVVPRRRPRHGASGQISGGRGGLDLSQAGLRLNLHLAYTNWNSSNGGTYAPHSLLLRIASNGLPWLQGRGNSGDGASRCRLSIRVAYAGAGGPSRQRASIRGRTAQLLLIAKI